jgi:D-alanyl-D-alanine dipeptidase
VAYPKNVLPGKLAKVSILSIYGNHDVLLPERMAYLVPGAVTALLALKDDVAISGGGLYLSDGFRSEEMQAQAHFDYLTGTKQITKRNEFVTKYPYLSAYTANNDGRGKTAFSPPPGGSWHEAGRAIDIEVDTKWMKISLDKFRALATARGWNRISSESWHFEFRGEFQDIYTQACTDLGDHDAAYKKAARAAVDSIYGRA